MVSLRLWTGARKTRPTDGTGLMASPTGAAKMGRRVVAAGETGLTISPTGAAKMGRRVAGGTMGLTASPTGAAKTRCTAATVTCTVAVALPPRPSLTV